VRISYDPNFRKLMDARYDPVLTTMARLADVIKVSDEDLHGLFRTDDAEAAFGRLRALNPQAAILFTRGAAGARFHAGGLAWQAPAPAIEVVDTIGAGDASISALLYSLMHRVDVDGAEHLRFAVAAGAAACTQAGAVPPTLGQVVAIAPNVTVTPLVEGTVSCTA
jgi:fructokinase